MNENEFRFKDTTRRAEILKNNHALFKRRACDPNYGSQADSTARGMVAVLVRAYNKGLAVKNQIVEAGA
jgi:hypothetical protein